MNGKSIVVIGALAAGAYLLLGGSGIGGGVEGSGGKKATAITGINPNVPTASNPDPYMSSPLAPTAPTFWNQTPYQPTQYQPTPYMLDQVASQTSKKATVAAYTPTRTYIAPSGIEYATASTVGPTTPTYPKTDFAPITPASEITGGYFGGGYGNPIFQGTATKKEATAFVAPATAASNITGGSFGGTYGNPLYSGQSSPTRVTSPSSSSKKSTASAPSNTVQSHPGSNSAPSYGSGW